HARVEDNRLVAAGRVRLSDRLAQVGLAGDGRVGEIVHRDRGRYVASLQGFQGQVNACPRLWWPGSRARLEASTNPGQHAQSPEAGRATIKKTDSGATRAQGAWRDSKSATLPGTARAHWPA